MYPYFFGNESLESYVIMMVLGILLAVIAFRVVCSQLKIPDKPYNFYAILGVASIVMGLLGAFSFQQLYNFIDCKINNTQYVVKGFTFMGGLIGAVVCFVGGALLFAKGENRNYFFKCANVAGSSIILGHAIGRIGCVLAGCCYGIEHEHLGLQFHGLDHKALPTNLYECIFLFLLYGVMLLLILKFNKVNSVLIIYGFSYSIFRFIIEFFRDDYRGALILKMSPSQWQSIILFLIACALAVYVWGFKKIPLQKKSFKESSNNANDKPQIN